MDAVKSLLVGIICVGLSFLALAGFLCLIVSKPFLVMITLCSLLAIYCSFIVGEIVRREWSKVHVHQKDYL